MSINGESSASYNNDNIGVLMVMLARVIDMENYIFLNILFYLILKNK